MEINCFSIPCTAPVSSAFPVCVCVWFSFCFCLELCLPCWKVFSNVSWSSSLNPFSRGNHGKANLMPCVNGGGRISNVV